MQQMSHINWLLLMFFYFLINSNNCIYFYLYMNMTSVKINVLL